MGRENNKASECLLSICCNRGYLFPESDNGGDGWNHFRAMDWLHIYTPIEEPCSQCYYKRDVGCL